MNFPAVPPEVPRRSSGALAFVGRLGLRILRWRIEGEIPNRRKFVVIVAPHTSNWDFVVGMCAALALDLDASWLGKHGIFRWPFAGLLRRLGGIPVRRDRAHNVVEQMVAEFARRDRLVLGIAPEGTRRRVSEWRSGYWHIARGAGVPIVPVALDYGSRTVRVGQQFEPGTNLQSDEFDLRGFFAHASGRH